MASISPARKAAFKILLTLEGGEGHSDELLRGEGVNALSPQDRNLTTALVLGVLRWQSVLDAQFLIRLAKPNVKLDAPIRVALRMGAYQLLHMDRIPAHAAINDSVELANRAGHKFAAGMVNAVLRNIARGDNPVPIPGAAEEAANPMKPAAGSEAEATRFRIESRAAYPAWMVERWVRHYGADAAYEICAYGLKQPQIAVRVARARTEVELADAGVRLGPGRLLQRARTVLEGDVTATAAYRAGSVRIQDEGSQLVAEIAACARREVDRDVMRVLDACAAPGGKTLILAERMPEAHIVACEASPLRHAALRARLASLGKRVECRFEDAAALGEEDAFDLVLVDAPCSGTGTLGRNPEIRHRLNKDDLTRQSERQKAILNEALHAVKPDGRVVYSTCSLEPEENEQVVEDSGATVIPMSRYVEGMCREGILIEDGARELSKCVTEDGALRLMPGALGSDGFYMVVLGKG